MSTDKALEIWTAQALCDTGIVASLVALALQIARPYFERVQARLTLRMAADLWGMAYLVLRDGSLFVAVLLGLFHLNLDLMADIKIGLPFVPLGTVALAAALVTKVYRDSEDPTAFGARLADHLVALGGLLNLAGYVLVMEAPGEEYAHTPLGWLQVLGGWRSNRNPALAAASFGTAVGLLAALAVISVALAARKRRMRRSGCLAPGSSRGVA